jgi:hypothetical protein
LPPLGKTLFQEGVEVERLLERVPQSPAIQGRLDLDEVRQLPIQEGEIADAIERRWCARISGGNRCDEPIQGKSKLIAKAAQRSSAAESAVLSTCVGAPGSFELSEGYWIGSHPVHPLPERPPKPAVFSLAQG